MGNQTIMERRGESIHAADTRSDPELVAAINAGDTEAFGVLYYRYRDWVVRQAFHFTASHDLALDVLQETFLYFLKKFPGFELTAQLKTFLYPAIRNGAIAARRKAARYQSDPAELEAAQAALAPSPATPDDEALTEVLAALPFEHREVLRLRFVDGLKLAEVAAALEVPLGTVKSRLHYALEMLRQDPRTKKFFAP